MRDKTQPEALRLADWLEAVGGGPSAKRCAALLRRQHARIAELEAARFAYASEFEPNSDGDPDVGSIHTNIRAMKAKPASIGAGGVSGPLMGQPQAMPDLSALTERGAKAWAGVDAQALRDGTHQQATPKAEPGVGNSGFDYKTAADLLNNKIVSDEAVRKFVAASRWAHDERAALSATLLAMHGVLTSREAEIALLKKALLEAEAAPQQEAQEPATVPYQKLTNEIDQILSDPDTELSIGAKRALLWVRTWVSVPLWTTPQPSPAPLSDDDLVELGKSEKSGLHPWGIGTTRADYLRAVRAVLDAARKQGDTPCTDQ